MDPRFGTLSHITLNRPKIYYVLKISSKAGMVHFVVVKSAGSSTLWTDFKYFKKEFIQIMCSLFGNTFRWRLVSFFVFFFCMMRLFTDKISEQTLICYVLNIVNNCKNLFIFPCSFYFLLFTLCPSG